MNGTWARSKGCAVALKGPRVLNALTGAASTAWRVTIVRYQEPSRLKMDGRGKPDHQSFLKKTRICREKDAGSKSQSLNDGLSFPHFIELLEEDFRCGPGGSRVLAGRQQAVIYDMHTPIGCLRKYGAELQHLVFNEKGHHLGESDVFF